MTSSNDQAANEKNKIFDILKIKIGLPVLMGFLFLFGSAWSMGFFRFFGIERTLLPLSFEMVLQNGAFALLAIGSDLITKIFLPSYISTVLVLFGSAVYKSIPIEDWVNKIKRSKIRSKLFRQKQSAGDASKQQESVPKLAYVSFSIFMVTLLLTIFLALCCGLLQCSYDGGKNHGKETLNSFNKKNIEGLAFSRKSSISIKTETGVVQITGYIIQCSSSHCLIYTGNQSKVIPISTITEISNDLIKPNPIK